MSTHFFIATRVPAFIPYANLKNREKATIFKLIDFSLL